VFASAGAVSQNAHHYFFHGDPRPRGRRISEEAEDNMKKLALKVRQFLVSEDGPTAVEYAVMLALIVIVCLTAINSVGQNASTTFSNVASSLSTINGS
jgi:pilus assembly protein Flp/PilA